MQPALDSNTLDRLITLGRKQGHLTNQDLEANLPIDAMSAEEIALIVVHLEETGIAVELDDSLISQPAKPSPAPARSAEIIPFPDRSAASRTKKRTVSLQAASPLRSETSGFARQEQQAAHWAAAVAGLVVLVLMVGALMLFGI